MGVANSYQRLMTVDLQRRAAALPREVTDWVEVTRNNVDGMGIHRSQFQTIGLMMQTLGERRDELVNQLSPDFSPERFTAIYNDILREIVGGHDVWRLFQTILTQRQDPMVKLTLDAADLIAADCYHTCMRQARSWGVKQAERFREPPLVLLEVRQSAATANRGKPIRVLGMANQHLCTQRLPIPIILFPVDQVNCIWLYSTIHHEVGHNLDQDLGLTTEVAHLIERRVAATRRSIWKRWTAEIIADTLGVLLGGVGFVYTMTTLLRLALTKPQIDHGGEHPDPRVRVYLLAALLTSCRVPRLQYAAKEILAVGTNSGGGTPRDLDAYANDAVQVADIVLTERLDSLSRRSLLNIVPDLATDAVLSDHLARYLQDLDSQPEPNNYPWRLVPPAAQLAIREQSKPTIDFLDAIQQRSIHHLHSIPRPRFLSNDDRRAFLRELTLGLRFDSITV